MRSEQRSDLIVDWAVPSDPSTISGFFNHGVTKEPLGGGILATSTQKV